MKLTVIGGGGVRSMFLAKSLAARAAYFGIDKLVFMDNDKEKLNIYGKMAKKVANLVEPKLDFEITDDGEYAIKDSDYVITTIRAGGDHLRSLDERAALNLGLLGQETTGAAGFSFAIRSVPSLAKYCELVKKHAKPNCKVFNFTNPVGVVSQTLRDIGYNFTYGICDAPSGMLCQFAKFLDIDAKDIYGECFGLNHLSFFNSITVNGKEIINELIHNPKSYSDTDLRYFSMEFVEKIGLIPNEYLYYFYNTQNAIDNIIKTGKTRGEFIEYYNEKMMSELKNIDIDNNFEEALAIFEKWYGEREGSYMANETGIKRQTPWKFDVYSKDEGGYAGVALRYIELERSGKTGNMILCVPNANGAIEDLEETDTVEATCTVSKDGCLPHKFMNLPKAEFDLVQKVKSYERLASKAIINKDKLAAINALTVHPLIADREKAVKLVDEFLQINKDFTSNWK